MELRFVYLFLCLLSLGYAVGDVVYKWGVSKVGELEVESLFKALRTGLFDILHFRFSVFAVFTLCVGFAFAIGFINTLLYSIPLSYIEVSRAKAIMSILMFMFLVLLSWVFLGESMSSKKLLGITLGCIAIWLLVSS